MSLDKKKVLLPSCITNFGWKSLITQLDQEVYNNTLSTQDLYHMSWSFNKYRNRGIYSFPELPKENFGMFLFSPGQTNMWELHIHQLVVNVSDYSLYMIIREITYRHPERYLSRFFSPYNKTDLFVSGILFTRNSIDDILVDYLASTPQGKKMEEAVIKIIVAYFVA